MSSLKILVTCGGSATALSVLKGIRLQRRVSAAVILGDCSQDIAGKHLADGFLKLPALSDPNYAEGMLALARDNHINLIVPLYDPEIPVLAAQHTRFEALGIRIAVSSSAAIRACRDKWQTYRFFVDQGLATPATWLPQRAQDIPRGMYPLIVKPRDGRASLNVMRVTSSEELAAALDKVDNALIQQAIEGKGVREVTIDTVSNVHGRFQGYCARYRDEIRAGQSYKGLTFRDGDLETCAQKICDALPIVGPACMQCFVTADGPVFFEINPRFGAATILSIRAGLNGPAFLAEECAGLTPSPFDVKGGIRMLRYWEEVIVSAETGETLASRSLE